MRGLCEQGHKVRVVALPGDPLVSRLEGLNVEIFYGDVADPSSLEGMCDGADTVFHLAAILLNDNAASNTSTPAEHATWWTPPSMPA